MIKQVIIVRVSVIVNNVNLNVTVGQQSWLGKRVTFSGYIFYHKNL